MPEFKNHIVTDSDITLSEGQVKSLTSTLAPFSVASQLLVGNLNADLLDGQHGSYYRDTANLIGRISVAQMPQLGGPGVILGRYSAGSGNVENIAIGSGLTLSSSGVLSASSSITESDPVWESYRPRVLYGNTNAGVTTYFSGSANDFGKTGFYHTGINVTDQPVANVAHFILHQQHASVSNSFWQLATRTDQNSSALLYRKVIAGTDTGWIQIQRADRTVTISGTAGRVAVTGGTQTLEINRTWTVDLVASGVGAGTYRSVTVDAYGRVTSGTNPTTLAGYGITDAMSQADADNRYLRTIGGTMDGSITFSTQNTGIFLPDGARVYKRSDGGLSLRRHSSNADPTIESNDGSQRWTIWHAGNITPVPTSRNLSFSANDGLNVSGTPISDLSGDRTVTFGITGISAAKITSGTLPVGRGGTGLTSVGSNGQVLMSNGSAMYWGNASGGVSGSGTTNYIPKFTGGTSIGNSIIREDSGRIGIDVAPFGIYKLAVNGYLYAGGDLDVSGRISANSGGIYADYGRIGSFGTDGSAVFQVNSSNKGSLPAPRMSTTDWNDIPSKATGLFHFNTSEAALGWWDGSRTCLIRFNGTKWQGWTGSAWADFH